MHLGHALLVVLIGAGVVGCGRPEQAAPADTLPVAKVQTTPVQLARLADHHEIVGTVRPTLSANVSAKVMAGIRAIRVGPGDRVSAGAILAELDDRDLRAEFDRAKSDFDRYQSLLEKAIVARAEFDAVQSRFRVAEANLSYAKLTAPFDGIIAQKFCAVGDLATPGKPLFSLEQPGHFRLEAHVPERFAGALALGQELDVLIEALNGRCRGPISEIIPAADPASRSFLIKIDLKGDKPLKSGLFGRAQLPVGERAAIQVPAAALHQRGQLSFVYVVADGRARMRLVRLGKPGEVLSGLDPGEQVVVAGQVADGQRVAP